MSLYRIAKRGVDIIGSLAGLLIIAPLYPVIILAIKLETAGSSVIGLTRMSNGKPIVVYKFRSMVSDALSQKDRLLHLNERREGPFFKMKHDPRVTKVGRILRKFRLDEFPQLYNVLKGEMSLVGPRPHELGEITSYPPAYQHIPLAKAGVTGLSQVNGASSLPFLRELELDDQYLKNQSLWLDLKIIFKTIGILFTDPTAV